MILEPNQLFTLGPEGTFSDQAARLLISKAGLKGVTIHYTRTIPEVLVRTEAEGHSLGVFPIENSVAGTVGPAQDALVNHRLTLLWEINIRVRFSMIANRPLKEVKTYFAHPQAFDQCPRYLTQNLSQGQVIFTNSNTESGQRFFDEGDSPAAAIVPIEFGAQHSDWLVAEDIQDYPNNTTRFLVGRRAEADEKHDFSQGKTSLLIEPHEDRPGLLHELLSIFQAHQLNLCRLESRPAKITPWNYIFYIDFNNGPATEKCLEELRATRNTIRVLGSYNLLE